MSQIPSAGSLVSRPLIVFRLPILISGLALILASLFVLSRDTPDFQIAAVGAPGSELTSTVQGRKSLDVYTDKDVSGVVCRDVQGSRAGAVVASLSGDQVVDGKTWFKASWQVKVAHGESVICTADGANEVMLGYRSGMGQTIQGAIFGLAGLLGVVFGVVGVKLAKRSRRGMA